MPRFKLHTPGAWGEKKASGEYYSQVMEIDGRVELSGQEAGTLPRSTFPLASHLKPRFNEPSRTSPSCEDTRRRLRNLGDALRRAALDRIQLSESILFNKVNDAPTKPKISVKTGFSDSITRNHNCDTIVQIGYSIKDNVKTVVTANRVILISNPNISMTLL